MACFARRQKSIAYAYEGMKGDLLDFRLPPGKPIPVSVVAARLAVSTRQARTACRQLVKEGWAIEVNESAFLAWRRDEKAIADQYDINEALLTSAVHHVRTGHAALTSAPAAIGRCRDILRAQAVSHRLMAAHTGTLFLAIVAIADKKDVEDLVRISNRRLYYLRIQECRYLEDVAAELVNLCDLALVGNLLALKRAIIAYHVRRRDFLPALYNLISAA